jgi:hypothetical protein
MSQLSFVQRDKPADQLLASSISLAFRACASNALCSIHNVERYRSVRCQSPLSGPHAVPTAHPIMGRKNLINRRSLTGSWEEIERSVFCKSPGARARRRTLTLVTLDSRRHFRRMTKISPSRCVYHTLSIHYHTRRKYLCQPHSSSAGRARHVTPPFTGAVSWCLYEDLHST